MNEKEVAELRRRLRQDRTGITEIKGCYVNEKGEMISQFSHSLGLVGGEETQLLLTALKKSLSGSLGRQLHDISFSTQEVVEGEAHKQLMALRQTELKEEALVQSFFQRVIATRALEGNYIILLAFDAYDVPYHSRDGRVQREAGSEVFRFLLCGLCPMRKSPSGLGYQMEEQIFRHHMGDFLLGPPELGFLFPAFEDRSTNLYQALYYTKSIKENYPNFVEEIFHAPVPMPAQQQRECFQEILGQALAEECSYEKVQAIHDSIFDLMILEKEEKEPQMLSKRRLKELLEAYQVTPQHIGAFEHSYDEMFGSETELRPKNLVNGKTTEIQMGDVTIHVHPDQTHLVQYQRVNGIPYLMIRAEQPVSIHGMEVQLEEGWPSSTDPSETESTPTDG